MLSVLTKTNDVIIKVTKYITIVAFALMVVASTAQILFRFVLQLPLDWTEELSRYMFVWSTMLGISVFTRKREHSSVDILAIYLPEKFHGSLYLLIDALCLIFYIVMIVGGATMSKVAMSAVAPATNIPMGFVYLAVPVSGIIMLLITIENIIKDIIQRKEKRA